MNYENISLHNTATTHATRRKQKEDIIKYTHLFIFLPVCLTVIPKFKTKM